MNSEYLIKGERPTDAKIFLEGQEVAEIKKGEGATFKLVSKDGHEWIITNKVHGMVRPFSISILQQNKDNEQDRKQDNDDKDGNNNQVVFTIREHLFKHKGKFYMLTNHPEGKHWNEYLSGPRYISRLDNFPYSNLTEIDNHIKHSLRRFRGVPVAEASGLGINGHHVKITSDEIKDIGLFIAASSYLIYSTG